MTWQTRICTISLSLFSLKVNWSAVHQHTLRDLSKWLEFFWTWDVWMDCYICCRLMKLTIMSCEWGKKNQKRNTRSGNKNPNWLSLWQVCAMHYMKWKKLLQFALFWYYTSFPSFRGPKTWNFLGFLLLSVKNLFL
jgi:hypothetical protein